MSSPTRNGDLSDAQRSRELLPVLARHKFWMFDFDNTLAPLEPAVDWAGSRRELQAWLAAQGVAPALFEEIPRGNLALYEALRARLAAGGKTARTAMPDRELVQPEIEALLVGASKIIEGYELAGASRVAPAPGALELLDALRSGGAKTAIVTSNSSRAVDDWLRANRARALVDVVVGRDRGLALKPSPATLACALAEADVSPAEAAFAGDSEADLKAAKAAAVRFYGIHAKPEGRGKLAALGASLIFVSPAQLLANLRSAVVCTETTD